MLTITGRMALSAIADAVSAKGNEYIDPNSAGDSGCIYVNGLEWTEEGVDFSNAFCGCIVGTALHSLGLTFQQIVGEDAGNNVGVSISGLSQDLYTAGIARIPIEALDIFAAAQEAQDAGNNWGYALSCAEAV
jgi:hypothetical protein